MPLLYLAPYLCVNTGTVLHYHNSSLSRYLQGDIDRRTNWQHVFTGQYSGVVSKRENSARSQFKEIVLSAFTSHFG